MKPPWVHHQPRSCPWLCLYICLRLCLWLCPGCCFLGGNFSRRTDERHDEEGSSPPSNDTSERPSAENPSTPASSAKGGAKSVFRVSFCTCDPAATPGPLP